MGMPNVEKSCYQAFGTCQMAECGIHLVLTSYRKDIPCPCMNKRGASMVNAVSNEAENEAFKVSGCLEVTQLKKVLSFVKGRLLARCVTGDRALFI